MNKLFLSLALLVPTIASAVRLETEFKVTNDSHKETFVIKDDEAVSFIYLDMIKLEVRAIGQEDTVIIDITTMKKDEAGNFVELSHDQMNTEWCKEVCLSCPKSEQEYSISVTAHKE